jgi:hypothetical protein
LYLQPQKLGKKGSLTDLAREKEGAKCPTTNPKNLAIKGLKYYYITLFTFSSPCPKTGPPGA